MSYKIAGELNEIKKRIQLNGGRRYTKLTDMLNSAKNALNDSSVPYGERRERAVNFIGNAIVYMKEKDLRIPFDLELLQDELSERKRAC